MQSGADVPGSRPSSPLIQRLSGIDIARLARYSGQAVSALAIGAGSRYLAAAYMSALASTLIYASGAEILPIGGFDGRTPEPSLARLRADVASGALHGLCRADEGATRELGRRQLPIHSDAGPDRPDLSLRDADRERLTRRTKSPFRLTPE